MAPSQIDAAIAAIDRLVELLQSGSLNASGGSAAPAKPAAAAAGPQPAAAKPANKPDQQQQPQQRPQAAKEPKQKKEKKKGGGGEAKAAAGGGAAPAAAAETTVDVLDLRVGVITAVSQHPDADSLYVEQIDLGEPEGPRTVISGLVKFVPEDKMLNRRVVVVTNFKPAKMRGILSSGMVLCASNEDHTQVDPIAPPQGAAIGEKISFEGYAATPEQQLNPKKKQWEKVAPDLKTDAAGLCTYRGVPFMTATGPCTATIPGAHIA